MFIYILLIEGCNNFLPIYNVVFFWLQNFEQERDVDASYYKFSWKRAVMCLKCLDDPWAPFPTNPFSVGFEMATVHSLLSFIGRTWEKGNKTS